MNRDTTYKAYYVHTPATELPVTLEQVRYHLRNEDLRFDDELLKQYIRAAANYVEKTYGLALLTQTIKQYHDSFPCGSNMPLLLRISPLATTPAIVITYTDTAGATQTWTSSEYTSGRLDLGGFIVPNINYTWPDSVAALPNAITVTYSAGFGTKPSTLPPAITSALLLIIGDMYQRREDSVANLPKASEYLLLPWYRWAA